MNAIIMAAGLGSRFKELTKHTHKSLLPINGKPNLERTIEMLKDADVEDITIVTGYLADQFDYLKSKYGVRTIFNEHFRDYNNLYSFALAMNYFGDTLVIDGDTVFNHNIFKVHPEKSTYFTIKRPHTNGEWFPVVNEDGHVTSMEVINDNRPTMSGVSYWNSDDAKEIIETINNLTKNNQEYIDASRYWDDIPVSLLDKLYVTTSELPSDSLFEMDNEDEYNEIVTKVK